MNGGQATLQAGILMEVPSTSTPGTVHYVRLSRNGLIYCDCEGFAWRGICSHVQAYLAQNPMAKVLMQASLEARIRHAQEALKALSE